MSTLVLLDFLKIPVHVTRKFLKKGPHQWSDLPQAVLFFEAAQDTRRVRPAPPEAAGHRTHLRGCCTQPKSLFLGQVPDSALPAQPAQLPPHMPAPPPAAHTLGMKDCPNITDAASPRPCAWGTYALSLRRGSRTVGRCDPFWALIPGASRTTPVFETNHCTTKITAPSKFGIILKI